jgi:signal transduction histidine kinase
MRLSQFILDNLEMILLEWEHFARSLPAGRTMSIEALRDDAERMLRFVAANMEGTQTRQQEVTKSRGRGPSSPPETLSASHEHGVARAVDRFSLIELVSEYRALRASVTRMWADAAPATDDSFAQIVRFNEAIDQILAEAVAKFSERLDRDADLFTGSIGHDLGNPVNSVVMSVRLLAASPNLSSAEQAAVARIQRAGGRLSAMLADLRDFTRTRLGALVGIDCAACDLGTLVRNIVDELCPVYPDRRIAVHCSGDLAARIDAKRIAQLVSNLVANALQHGAANGDVTVSAHGDADSVTIEVHNIGPAIEPALIRTLFDPIRRPLRHSSDNRLGLGLYIVQQIVRAHGGTIEVSSTAAAGTRFAARFPRGANNDASNQPGA